jgi:hypothetical protein
MNTARGIVGYRPFGLTRICSLETGSDTVLTPLHGREEAEYDRSM